MSRLAADEDFDNDIVRASAGPLAPRFSFFVARGRNRTWTTRFTVPIVVRVQRRARRRW